MKFVKINSDQNNSNQDKSFRIYDDSTENAIRNHYRNLRKNQTFQYNIKMRQTHARRIKTPMTIWEAFQHIEKFIDVSDPDINLPNLHHAFQVAEKIRKDGHPEWFQLTGLIHDLGKIMYLWGNDEEGTSIEHQWGICGDTFIVGCKIPKTVVFPEFNKLNPDVKCDVRNSKYGIYHNFKLGLNNCICSWGHDEYLYQVLNDSRNKHSLPPQSLYIIRYHSLYPWHNKGEYKQFENSDDIEMKDWVKLFNKYDLYTKENIEVDVDKLKKYYDKLINNFFQVDQVYF